MNVIARRSEPSVQQILVPTTFDQLVRFAELAAQSGMVPKDYIGKPGAIMIAVQMGSELGLAPMQSLTSIAVINGRPGVWGDGMIGLCRQSPLCQDIVETFEGEGENRTAVCVATRRGSSPTVGRFSVADAKKAGLWNKNIWAAYPDRMLQNRARGFALRDAFPDLLRGLKTVEELRDTPADTFQGATLDAKPEPPTAPAQTKPHQTPTPERPKGRSARQLLADIDKALTACATMDEVDAVQNGDDVQRLFSTFDAKHPAITELNALLNEAVHRCVKAREEAEATALHNPETGEVAIDDEIPF